MVEKRDPNKQNILLRGGRRSKRKFKNLGGKGKGRILGKRGKGDDLGG